MAAQQLPQKDQAVFRSIVKFYETKQYKKGVKAADSILKKHPDHGETLCMKGLTLSYLDRKEEAYELVRKGLKHGLKSHVCWHVFGLLYRQDRDYVEAVKCYRQALRIDPENVQIMRDLALLQIHRRDLSGFVETRRKLLQVKPSNRLNWVGYAIAEHLCQSFDSACLLLDNYEQTFKDESVTDYEQSELHLYKAMILEEAGRFDEALTCLTSNERAIVDKLGLQDIKARLLMFLQRFDEAAEIYRRLIQTNPEHHLYILGCLASQTQFHRFWPALPAPAPRLPAADAGADGDAAPPPATICSFPASMHPEGVPIWGWLPPAHTMGSRRRIQVGKRLQKRRLESYEPMHALTGEEQEDVSRFFDELAGEHPKSDSITRIPLYFVSGALFEKRLDAYLRPRIRKGIPSLFRMIRPLYYQAGKPEIISGLLEQYLKHLKEETASFGPKRGEEHAGGEDNEEAPSALLFTLMLAAEHNDMMGDTEKALELIDQAIEHTPTLVELYACKARIYKHTGDLDSSAKWFEEVRTMDLADRFLNTQAARAFMRKDDVQTGVERVLLFTKEPGAPEATNLHDMQCMWYESAMGRSLCRQRMYGKALKKFHETFKHFADINEDQFDYHNYCLRKTTLKAYVSMLRTQDRLFSQKFYRRAAKDAIRIYLEIHDAKARGEGTEAKEEEKEAEISPEEKRKQKHKKKREAKAEAKAEPKPAQGGKPKKIDEDPDGLKLLEKDPLAEASKLARTLVRYCGTDCATWILTFDCYSRQGKLLLCLQALLRLHQLVGGNHVHHKLLPLMAQFCFSLAPRLEEEGTPEAVKAVVLSEIPTVLGGEGEPFESVAAMKARATAVVDSVEQKLRGSSGLPVVEVISALKCLKHAGRSCDGFIETWAPEGGIRLKECRKALAYLHNEFGADSAVTTNFLAQCRQVFPLMPAPSTA